MQHTFKLTLAKTDELIQLFDSEKTHLPLTKPASKRKQTSKNKNHTDNSLELNCLVSSLETIISNIEVHVNFNQTSKVTSLEYQITLPLDIIDMMQWSSPKDVSQKNSLLKFTDYLWESSCLECFFGSSKSTEYVELNVSPDGKFAIYHFDDYRTPQQMPPRHLTLPHDLDSPIKLTDICDPKNLIRQHNTVTKYRHIQLNTSVLPFSLRAQVKINISAILYLTINEVSIPLFFAIKHTTPPDFHHQSAWFNIPNSQ